MSNKSGVSAQIISAPKGGGALHGIGEKFSPDLFTGTGNFTVPLGLPPGRNGFQPELNLVYSTGNGNGAFGLGWSLSIPGVSRQTYKGIPRYNEGTDIFILSGAEDLVPMAGSFPGRVSYRPRTEGLFAHIERQRDAQNDFWEVRSKDGLVSRYGTPRPTGAPASWQDPAVVADPLNRNRIFAWHLSETRDPFGNGILYSYRRDQGRTAETPPQHEWNQLYLEAIRYVEYDDNGQEKFLVSVHFDYEERPDPFSSYRAGFEVRTRLRCRAVEIRTHPNRQDLARHYGLAPTDPNLKDYIRVRDVVFGYESSDLNGVSLLKEVRVVGYDDTGTPRQELPPLEFGYTSFTPQTRERRFFPVAGANLPSFSLADRNVELVDLFGNGLPDILEMNGTARYWRNLGEGCFDEPRMMREAPSGLSLGDPGVQMVDVDGDGRIDLLANLNGMSRYFPLQPDGLWDQRTYRRFEVAPTFSLEDPEVKLVDLDGDGRTDVLRSGARFECFFSEPQLGWTTEKTLSVERRSLEIFPNVRFADPRVKWGDMSGDNLQDIVLVYDGNVEYWPNLGHGNWGNRIHMRNSPRFPNGYDPQRILLGDVDGDGLADIVYVDDRKVLLWLNQSGNRWGDPIEIDGTPVVTDMDAVRLVDLLGNGTSGVLWSREANALGRPHLFFLDFTGDTKPYLLNQMDNHLGATTKVEYGSSTKFYLQDQRSPATRWKTPLPFPVQVVSRVEVIDNLSKGKLTTEYRYHHGYWDGAEREFRGFGMVEQLDTETFTSYHEGGLHSPEVEFTNFVRQHPRQYFAPPTLTRTWFHQFHQGPVGEEFGEWREVEHRDEYWPGDPQRLDQYSGVQPFLRAYPAGPRSRRIRRDALRTLRGSILRTELYALDRFEGQARLGPEDRPYTVTEYAYGLQEIAPPAANDARLRIFYAHPVAQRSTEWDRGNDPLTRFSFTDYRNENGQFDPFGRQRRQTHVACPRGWRGMDDRSNDYLATRTFTEYAMPLDPALHYIYDRVSRVTRYEITNKTTAQQPTNDAARTVAEVVALPDSHPALKVDGQTINYYDFDSNNPPGSAFVGLPFGQIGWYGALVRIENLVHTSNLLTEAYGNTPPPYLTPGATIPWTAEYPAEFRTHLAALPGRAGYEIQMGVQAEYFSQPDRRSYDVHASQNGLGQGLLRARRGPLGQETNITYDPYDLLPTVVTEVIDSATNWVLTTQAEYNYRVLQPSLLTDSNGNENGFAFTPAGLLQEQWIRGHPTRAEGDRQHPSLRLEYDFQAYSNSVQQDPLRPKPVFARTIRRIHHDTQTGVPQPERDETIETREFSDGFGRLIQSRAQAEDMLFGDATWGQAVISSDQSTPPAPTTGRRRRANDPLNVLVSGWQLYDNKGRVVEKYEPFFGQDWEYQPESEAKQGVFATLFYDPRGRLIGTVNPNGSEQRMIYGVPRSLEQPTEFDPTPWETYTYDANDLAGATHPNQSQTYDHHWSTPASTRIDALGRTVEMVERNRAPRTGGVLPLGEEYRTRSTYDIRGNLLTVTDPLGRLAFRYSYDLADRPLRVVSLDGGDRQAALDAAGNVLETRDNKGALALRLHEGLNRPTHLWARDGTNQILTLRERLIYGDEPGLNLPPDRNPLGRIYQYYDEAGRVTFVRYDFKGNLLEKERQVIDPAQIANVFAGAAGVNWQVQAYRVDWEPPTGQTLLTHAGNLLDPTRYETSTTYDALNRVRALRYPTDTAGVRRELRPLYNRAGTLEQVTLDGATYVERIAYDAKGQRTLIAYGNGVMTRCAYDRDTFRLVRLCTERFTHPGGDLLVFQPDTGLPVEERLLQDFSYQYDLAGNVLRITDLTPGSGVRNNPNAARFPTLAPGLAAGDVLVRECSYDPLYRLVQATGRECSTITHPRPWLERPWPNDSCCGYHPAAPDQNNARDLTSLYTETYAYDAAGNMISLAHSGSGNLWTRRFGLGGLTPQQWGQEWRQRLAAANGGGAWQNAPGNRLTYVGDNQPAVPPTHFFDAAGNLIGETTSRHFEWDHANRLRVYRTQAGNAEPSIHAHYLYDNAGQRVMKLVRRQGGAIEVTVYLDGFFENHRWQEGGQPKENNHLHVMDNQSRVALLRVGDVHPDDSGPVVQYHLADHLSSSSLVLGGPNAAGRAFINREEYFPYGETSFGSFGRKRYRFTGKERDEESGLYYSKARYYACWIARWISADPAGYEGGLNLYEYAYSNPIVLTDFSGLQASSSHLLQGSANQPVPNAASNTANAAQQRGLTSAGTVDAGVANVAKGANQSGDTLKPLRLLVYQAAKEGVPEIQTMATEPQTGQWDRTAYVKSFSDIVSKVKELSRNHKIEALGILVHGDAAGRFTVGSDTFRATNLPVDQLKELAQYLAPDAKIYMYGCIAAADKDGTILLKELSKLLPGRTIIGFNTINQYEGVNPHYINSKWYSRGTLVHDPIIMSAPLGMRDDLSLRILMSKNPEKFKAGRNEANEKADQAKVALNGNIIKWPKDETAQRHDAVLGQTPMTRPPQQQRRK
jgi:RHS repeat-associated protein